MPQTVRLIGPAQRALARRLIDAAPDRTVVTFSPETRTLEQNARLWAMLSDVARARPEGRTWPPETWKAAFMSALGHEVIWQPGIEGGAPFPAGFRSSRLTKPQMSDLIELIYAYGARHGVVWSESQERMTA
jgi:hypothetical protein